MFPFLVRNEKKKEFDCYHFSTLNFAYWTCFCFFETSSTLSKYLLGKCLKKDDFIYFTILAEFLTACGIIWKYNLIKLKSTSYGCEKKEKGRKTQILSLQFWQFPFISLHHWWCHMINDFLASLIHFLLFVVSHVSLHFLFFLLIRWVKRRQQSIR